MLNPYEIDEYINLKRYRQINSVLVSVDNDIVIERYYNTFDENSTNVIKSVAKSIMSICLGVCLDKGFMKSLDEPISKYIPIFNQGYDPLHRAITIRHLLSMTSGIYFNGGIHYHCPMFEQMKRSGDWIAHIADIMIKYYPGTYYCYKEWDVILLAKVMENALNQDLFDFLNKHVYIPLEIESGRWWKSKCGVTYSVADGDKGADENASNLTARDMLKIGRLFLDKGMYKNNRIVSEGYITSALSPLKCNQGYGLLWWLGDNWYGCRGYGGQSITVFPDKNTVIVTQATPTSRGMSYDDVIWFVLDHL